MPRLSTLFTPQKARLGLTRCNAQKTRGGRRSGTMACARRSPVSTEEGKGRFLCRLRQGLGSKAQTTLDERFPLERWPATSWWHRSPEATGITPQGSARGGQAGAKRPSYNPMTCPNTDCGCEGSSRTRKKGQNQIKTSAAKNLRLRRR